MGEPSIADARPMRSFEVQTRTVDDILYLVRGRSAYELNELGDFLWNHCDGRQGFSDMLLRVVEKFDVSETAAQQDMCEFFDFLASEHLLADWRS